MATGIRKLHSKGCAGADGGRCRCGAGWEASVYSKRDRKKIRRTFARETEAKSWRADAVAALERGALRAPKPTTVEQALARVVRGGEGGAQSAPLGRSVQAVVASFLQTQHEAPGASGAR
jgi:hypothetical protein